MKHYSEADLLETYYMQPGDSMPVMMHLSECSDCASRYERLEKKLRSITACESDVRETFWSRQRMLITRKIGDQQSRLSRAARVTRIAAGVAFAFLLGGAVMYKAVEPALEPPVLQAKVPIAQSKTPVKSPSVRSHRLEHDAWQSDELKDFHSVVGWETWVDSSGVKGDEL